jgi:hypothetical protein
VPLKITRTPGDALELTTPDGTQVRLEVEAVHGKLVTFTLKAPTSVKVRWVTAPRAKGSTMRTHPRPEVTP